MADSPRPLRVYIAGSGNELPRVRAWMQALRDVGIEITKDWTAEVEASIARGGDAGLTDEEQARVAHEDLAAVLAADVVWLLAPVTVSRGAWIEFGYALGRGRMTAISGRGARRTIFAAAASRAFDADSDAYTAIVEHGRERGNL